MILTTNDRNVNFLINLEKKGRIYCFYNEKYSKFIIISFEFVQIFYKILELQQ